MKKTLFVLLGVAFLLLGGCAQVPNANSFGAEQAQTPMRVQFGRVLQVNASSVRPGNTVAGTSEGAIAGGVLGSFLGQGRGSIVGAVAGMIAGAVAGHLAEATAATKTGQLVTVKLDNGQIMAVAQTGITFKRGQRVEVVYQGNHTRVLPVQS
jgi:outer membrane lipoprotein SlyB